MRDPEAPGRDFPSEYHILRTVEWFTGAHIGAIGTTPAHVSAFRELLAHEKAADCFRSLIDCATLAGQLYGLAGVYFTDHGSLAHLARPYETSEVSVTTMFACVFGPTPVKEIVKEILAGTLPKELRGVRGA